MGFTVSISRLSPFFFVIFFTTSGVIAQMPTLIPYSDSLFDHDSDGDVGSRDLLLSLQKWGLQGTYRLPSEAPVRQLFAELFGLYDMTGNVYEGCQDSYHADDSDAANDGSEWEDSKEASAVYHDGSWVNSAEGGRSAVRDWEVPSDRYYGVGFGFARAP